MSFPVKFYTSNIKRSIFGRTHMLFVTVIKSLSDVLSSQILYKQYQTLYFWSDTYVVRDTQACYGAKSTAGYICTRESKWIHLFYSSGPIFFRLMSLQHLFEMFSSSLIKNGYNRPCQGLFFYLFIYLFVYLFIFIFILFVNQFLYGKVSPLFKNKASYSLTHGDTLPWSNWFHLFH